MQYAVLNITYVNDMCGLGDADFGGVGALTLDVDAGGQVGGCDAETLHVVVLGVGCEVEVGIGVCDGGVA